VGNSNTVLKIKGKTRYGNVVLEGLHDLRDLYEWRRRIGTARTIGDRARSCSTAT
jgi:hypothetical protein